MNEPVLIVTSHTTIELSWKSREALLHEIRHLEAARAIIGAFEAVGTSRPVPLTRHDEGLLFEAINQWSQGVTVEGTSSGDLGPAVRRGRRPRRQHLTRSSAPPANTLSALGLNDD